MSNCFVIGNKNYYFTFFLKDRIMKNLLKRFSIGSKLVFSSLVFILPIAISFVYVIKGFNANISFAESEIEGTQLIIPTIPLIEKLSKIQIIVKSIQIKNQSDNNLLEIETETTKSIKDLDDVFQKYESDLNINYENLKKLNFENYHISSINTLWNDIKAKLSAKDYESANALLVQMSSSIQGLISHVGNVSNLILDPDLDSYYLMDAVVVGLPLNFDRLANIHNELFSMKENQFELNEKIKIAVFAELLKQSDLDRIKNDITISIREDKNFNDNCISFQSTIPPLLDVYTNKTSDLIGELKKVSLSNSLIIDENNLLNSSKDQTQKLWASSAIELIKMLEMRINNIKSQKYLAIFFTLLSILFAIFVVVIIGRSIVLPMKQVILIADSISQGLLDLAKKQFDQVKH